jgi:hypothetical protein
MNWRDVQVDFYYSPTETPEGDKILNKLTEGSDQDPRFKFQIGDIVMVEYTAGGSQAGVIAEIRHRRNAYPPPMFNTWVPIYFLKHLDDSVGGGEIGEDCIRLATDEEKENLWKNMQPPK